MAISNFYGASKGKDIILVYLGVDKLVEEWGMALNKLILLTFDMIWYNHKNGCQLQIFSSLTDDDSCLGPYFLQSNHHIRILSPNFFIFYVLDFRLNQTYFILNFYIFCLPHISCSYYICDPNFGFKFYHKKMFG